MLVLLASRAIDPLLLEHGGLLGARALRRHVDRERLLVAVGEGLGKFDLAADALLGEGVGGGLNRGARRGRADRAAVI